jgi:O-antigen/teichoic acid export membrane protein
MNNSKGKAIEAGIGYTIGNIFIKGINFLALPLFSRLMTTEEFGIFNVFVSYEAILYILIGLAIHSSIRSANYKFKNKIDEYVSSVTLIYILMMFAFIAVVVIFGNFLSVWMAFRKCVLYFLIIYSFSSAILLLYNNRISLEYAYKKYLVISFVNSFGNVLISLLLMFTIFSAQRDLGRILGCTSILAFISIYILISFYRKASPKFNKDYWKFAVKYSLPIVPHGISQVILSQFDRIMIRSLVNDSAVGIYSLAGNIRLVLVIITDSISNVWSTWYYEKIDKSELKEIQERAKQLCLLFMVFSIVLMAFSNEMILILGGENYVDGRYVVIPMIMDAFVMFVYSIIVVSEYHAQKTTYIMFGTIVAAIVNLITNYIFIKKYGFVAAAYTTLFSYICYLFMHIIITRKLLKCIVIPLKYVLIYSFVIIIMAIIDLYFIDVLLIRLICCLIVAIPTLVILYIWFRKESKNECDVKKNN